MATCGRRIACQPDFEGGQAVEWHAQVYPRWSTFASSRQGPLKPCREPRKGAWPLAQQEQLAHHRHRRRQLASSPSLVRQRQEQQRQLACQPSSWPLERTPLASQWGMAPCRRSSRPRAV